MSTIKEALNFFLEFLFWLLLFCYFKFFNFLTWNLKWSESRAVLSLLLVSFSLTIPLNNLTVGVLWENWVLQTKILTYQSHLLFPTTRCITTRSGLVLERVKSELSIWKTNRISLQHQLALNTVDWKTTGPMQFT